MPKGYKEPKNLKRFKASDRLNLLFLQTFTFGIYNARLKLKEDKVRYSEVLTVFIVGEMHGKGCKISEFRQILGYNATTSRNALKRAANRNLIYSHGGRPGRGKATIFELTMKGQRVFETLQKEMGKTLDEAKNLLLLETRKRLVSQQLR